jgi:hypothetical protein
MRHFRLSLLELLIGTTLAGLSCAAMVNANYPIATISFFALLIAWIVATAVGVNPQAKSRPFWLAFLAMSLIAQYPASTPINRALHEIWVMTYGTGAEDPFEYDGAYRTVGGSEFFVMDMLDPSPLPDPFPGARVQSRRMFEETGHSVVSLWLGLIAGLLARAVQRSTETKTLAT